MAAQAQICVCSSKGTIGRSQQYTACSIESIGRNHRQSTGCILSTEEEDQICKEETCNRAGLNPRKSCPLMASEDESLLTKKDVISGLCLVQKINLHMLATEA